MGKEIEMEVENKQIAFGAAASVAALLTGYMFMKGNPAPEVKEKAPELKEQATITEKEEVKEEKSQTMPACFDTE